MFNRLDETLVAAPETDEKTESAAEEIPARTEPKNLNYTGAGFRHYVTHPLSREETIQRIEDFISRKDEFIAALRKSQGRDIPS